MRIEIRIDSNSKLPIVFVEGKKIEGIVSLDLSWVTNDKYTFELTHIDKTKEKIIKKGFSSI